MKYLAVLCLILASACSREEVDVPKVEEMEQTPNNPSQDKGETSSEKTKLLVGSWKFFKSKSSLYDGIMEYALLPEYHFKSDLSGVEYPNYVFVPPVAEDEKVKPFSYTLTPGTGEEATPLILTLKYSKEIRVVEVSFENNNEVLVLTSRNAEDNSYNTQYYNKIQ